MASRAGVAFRGTARRARRRSWRVPTISTPNPAVGRVPMNTPTTISREKSTAGSGAVAGVRACQSFAHSAGVRAITCRASIDRARRRPFRSSSSAVRTPAIGLQHRRDSQHDSHQRPRTGRASATVNRTSRVAVAPAPRRDAPRPSARRSRAASPSAAPASCSRSRRSCRLQLARVALLVGLEHHLAVVGRARSW